MEQIVIIDDDRVTLEILFNLLCEEYKVLTFDNPIDGHEYIKSNAPSIVLLDINMPQINGIELCQQIKQDSSMKYTSVLFLTSLDSQSDEQAGLEAGAVDYITKPLCLPIIKNRVKIHISLNLHRKVLSALVKQQATKIQQSDDEFMRLFIKKSKENATD